MFASVGVGLGVLAEVGLETSLGVSDGMGVAVEVGRGRGVSGCGWKGVNVIVDSVAEITVSGTAVTSLPQPVNSKKIPRISRWMFFIIKLPIDNGIIREVSIRFTDRTNSPVFFRARKLHFANRLILEGTVRAD